MLQKRKGQPLVDLPLMERKAILKESVKVGSHIIINDYVEEKGEQFYLAVLKQDLEGMVAKRKNSCYEEGLRTGSWLKVKNLKSCDCVIFGYSKGEGARESTFGALVVGLYDAEGKPVYVAHWGTGFTQQLPNSLFADFKNSKKHQRPSSQVTWMELRGLSLSLYAKSSIK